MRATSRLRTDRDWRALDPATARRTAAEINAERSMGQLPGPPTLTGGQLLAARVLRTVARRLAETAMPAAATDDSADAPPATVTKPAARRSPPKPLVDRLVLELLGDDPATPSVRDLLEPGPAAGALSPEAQALLRALPRSTPESLVGRLLWIREHWPHLLEPRAEVEPLLLLAADLVAEEARAMALQFRPQPAPSPAKASARSKRAAGDALGGIGFGGHGPAGGPDYAGMDAEPERFSLDTAWMPEVVLQAKATYVWLDQLSRRHGRDIRTLDGIPDEELERLASWGVTALWLIGIWQRSHASAEIKHRRGNPDAVASAYSLDDYRIADDLGGEAALERLRERAAGHGIRLASDMVPNHMGLDSTWVIEHPERFIALAEPPYPAYSFTGPDVSQDPDVEIRIEDQYWDATDAAVVFERTDRRTGDRRYIYHGNDGTSFPWNDTAQLDYLRADVRETVIRTIVDVARRFPIIRFDAAMALARRHIRRLWWPEPGAGGGIPSRAEHAISGRAFATAMPREFWREVVDRVAVEVPGTLLLAEAFWLMEGFFVRTLGMHRVYNSAFMHMLRDENGPGYRKVIKETLAFDPQVLGRFVNFMTNPDEATAMEQFGAGEKYFGTAAVLATMPGLPMLGHGQMEGLGERYGMEFRRPMRDERPNEALMARHAREIVPLLRERRRYAGSADFRLYDVVTESGRVDEHVYAYSNGQGAQRSLVVYHDRFARSVGTIRVSVPFAGGPDRTTADGSGPGTETLAAALGLEGPDATNVTLHDPRTGATLTSTVGEIRETGLTIRLEAYEYHVFTEIRVGSG